MDRGILRGKNGQNEQRKGRFLVGSAQNLPGNPAGPPPPLRARRPVGILEVSNYGKGGKMYEKLSGLRSACGGGLEGLPPTAAARWGRKEPAPVTPRRPVQTPKAGKPPARATPRAPVRAPGRRKPPAPGTPKPPVQMPGAARHTARPPRGGTPNHRPCGGCGRPSAHPSI